MGMHCVAVVGGGPAGLMAAEVLGAAGLRVEVFDAMPSLGRKFLRAGIGGLNITHGETKTDFLKRYGASRHHLEPLLEHFDADAVREWVHGFGIDTFVGSSGRVFPRGLKAAPLLRAWLQRLRAQGTIFHARHRWLGWSRDDNPRVLRFAASGAEVAREFDAVVFALGGGSWPRLGSDGAWLPLLQQRGVDVAPLLPSNCGFELEWSAHFRERYAGHALKPIIASAVDAQGNVLTDANGEPCRRKGECIVTNDGLEGGALYALSGPLRDEIARSGCARVQLDLAPDRPLAAVVDALQRPRGRQSLGNHLRRQLNIAGARAGVLFETLDAAHSKDAVALAHAIKSATLIVGNTRPLAEAISTAGGVRFDALTPQLMIRNAPGLFCAGEMLDWDAPTGGYLLTACLATGRCAGAGVVDWLHRASP